MHSCRRRAWILLQAFWLAGVGAASQASPASVPPPTPLLAGRNVILADTSSMMRVHLPRRVTLSTRTRDGRQSISRFFRASRTSGFVGVALVKITANRFDPSELFLIGRFAACTKADCEPRKAMPVLYPNGDRSITIEAGTYRLMVITTQRNTRAILRLPSLDGRSSFAPSAEANVDFQDPPVRLGSARDSQVYSSGAVFDSGRVGFALSMMSLRLDASHHRYAHGICLYSGPAPPPDVAYGPHCGSASSSFHIGLVSDVHRYQFAMLTNYSGSSYLDDGDEQRSIGVWAAATSSFIKAAGARILTVEVTSE